MLSFHVDISNTKKTLVVDNNDVDDNLVWLIDSEQHYYEFALDVLNNHIFHFCRRLAK